MRKDLQRGHIMDVPIPKNLPTLLSSATPEQAETIQRILGNQLSLEDALIDITRHWKVHVWFSEPVEIYQRSRWLPWKTESDGRKSRSRSNDSKTVYDHIFSRFCRSGGSLVYSYANARYGWPVTFIDKIVRYEPVSTTEKDRDEFANFDEFKKKFDLFFITDTEIQKLWASTSSQTGKQYRPSDFRRIGQRGWEVMQRFLKRFNGVTSTDPSEYKKMEDNNLYMIEYYNSHSHTGRDIRISHRFGNSYVWYSSEYHGCGNGRYGLVANRHEFLWLEDD